LNSTPLQVIIIIITITITIVTPAVSDTRRR
jgi:hypothetical protein